MLKKSVLLPIMGQDFSIPSTVLNSRSSFSKNCMVQEGVITQREGHGAFGSTAMSSAVLEFGKFQLSDGTIEMTRFSATKSEYYNPSTEDWEDITSAGGDWNTVEGEDYYDTTVYDDELVVTNGVDNIQKYTGSGTAMSDLGGSPPKARYCETVSEYVILGYTIDGGTTYPYRVQWCNTADIEDWSTGNSGYSDLTDNDQRIICIKRLNENLVVFKERSIYVGRLVDTTDVWSFDLVESGQELLNHRAVVEWRGKLYYLSTDGNIYVFNGYSSSPIGNKLQNQIKDTINSDRIGMTFARLNIYRDTIDFFICTNGNDYPTTCWCLNYEDGSIFYDTVDEIICASSLKDSEQLAYDDFDDTYTYANITRSYDADLEGSGFEFKIIGKSDGEVHKESSTYLNDDDTAINQEFITQDIHFDDHERLNRWSYIVAQLLGTKATVYYSTDYGTTYTVINHTSSQQYTDLTTAFSNYTWWHDSKSQYIRFKFSNTDSSGYFSLRQFALYGSIAEEVYR